MVLHQMMQRYKCVLTILLLVLATGCGDESEGDESEGDPCLDDPQNEGIGCISDPFTVTWSVSGDHAGVSCADIGAATIEFEFCQGRGCWRSFLRSSTCSDGSLTVDLYNGGTTIGASVETAEGERLVYERQSFPTPGSAQFVFALP